MRALLECLPCWLICSLLSLTFASFPLPLSVRRQLLAREGWAQSLVCSCCATTCSCQPWASLIKIWWKFSGLHLYLISRIFPYFQHLPFFLSLLFLFGTFLILFCGFLDTQAHVSKLNGPGAAAQHVIISLVAGDSVSCISVTGGLRTCSFL